MVGPYAVVGAKVTIGPNCRIGPHAVLEGRLAMGRDNRVFPGACLGLAPQDLKYQGCDTEVRIGDGNTFREYVTVNRATEEGQATRVGDGNLVMAYCHVAHNCTLGNGGGHVQFGAGGWPCEHPRRRRDRRSAGHSPVCADWRPGHGGGHEPCGQGHPPPTAWWRATRPGCGV